MPKPENITDIASHIGFLIIAYLTPLQPFVVVIGILILFDFATGFEKHRRNKSLEVSSGIGTTIDKIIAYSMFILVTFMIEITLLQVDWGLTKVSVCIIGLREAISIFENLSIITKWNGFNQFGKVLKEKLSVFMQMKIK